MKACAPYTVCPRGGGRKCLTDTSCLRKKYGKLNFFFLDIHCVKLLSVENFFLPFKIKPPTLEHI